MKTSLYYGLIFVLLLGSCEKSDYNADYDVLLKTEGGLSYRYSDFALYDSSTHIFYFKTNHPELKTGSTDKFFILADGQEIYQGPFLPGYSSYLPAGPFIPSYPYFYQNYALKIECQYLGNKKDLRNDPAIIKVLEERGLLHSGLKVSLDPLEINGTSLTFKFTVTNYDTSDLLIIDPDKTGPNLFHYFTNGLSIYDPAGNLVFKSNIEYSAPPSFKDWKIDWLSVLKSGDSIQFAINYLLNAPINQGSYQAKFEFPGLAFQISIDQLYQNNDRIWLGDIQVNKTMTIN
jgi:hypothetical protein